MNKVFLTSALFLAVILSGCQNDGHIGDIFGSWVLKEMTVDGKESAPEFPTAFSFQGDIVQVTRYVDDFTAYRSFGTWERKASMLEFNFTYTNDEGNTAFTAPWWIGFESGQITTVTITRLDSSHLDFRQTAADGTEYTYKFDRTW